MIENLLKLLEKGQDSAMLRFGLGSAYLKQGDAAEAARHLAKAVELDPGYSAAWKLYGKAVAESGDSERALEVYRQGIAVAEQRGDMQAIREMQVFLKRLSG
jgi:Tfp pilus assembly protein PilF